MISEPVLRGPRHDIVYVTEGTGSALTFRQFVETIRARGRLAGWILGKESDGQDRPREWKRLLVILKLTVDRGLDEVKRNPTRCKVFLDEIWEFKVRPWRVMFFVDVTRNDRIVITHCFRKKQDRTPPEQIERVQTLRERYYERYPSH